MSRAKSHVAARAPPSCRRTAWPARPGGRRAGPCSWAGTTRRSSPRIGAVVGVVHVDQRAQQLAVLLALALVGLVVLRRPGRGAFSHSLLCSSTSSTSACLVSTWNGGKSRISTRWIGSSRRSTRHASWKQRLVGVGRRRHEHLARLLRRQRAARRRHGASSCCTSAMICDRGGMPGTFSGGSGSSRSAMRVPPLDDEVEEVLVGDDPEAVGDDGVGHGVGDRRRRDALGDGPLDVVDARRRTPGRRPASRRARPASCGRRRRCWCAPSRGTARSRRSAGRPS